MKEGLLACRAWAFDGGPIYRRGHWNVLAKPKSPIDIALDCYIKVGRAGLRCVLDPCEMILGSDWRSNNVVH